MSERVICIRGTVDGSTVGGGGREYDYYYPDSEAPSVSEVVEALRDAREGTPNEDMGTIHRGWRLRNRIDALIARLTGGNEQDGQ